MLTIPVLVGSLRRGRNTPRLGRLLHSVLVEDPRVATELIDVADLDLPILEERFRNLENPPPALVTFCGALERCDALVVVCPEYNKGYPAALKNALDALGQELRRKPVGIAAHSVGAFGGQVVLQQLRPVFTNLGAVAIPAAMTIPHIAQAIAEDGTPADAELHARTQRFLDELVWYAEALRERRSRDV